MSQVVNAASTAGLFGLTRPDTASLRIEFHSHWRYDGLLQAHPGVEALCRRSTDPAQFAALRLHPAFTPSGSTCAGVERFFRFPWVVWRTLLLYSGERLEALIILQEATAFGLPTGYFRGFDSKGETLIIAEAGREEYWLAAALQVLLDSRRGFLAILDREKRSFATQLLPEAYQLNSEPKLLCWQHPLQPDFDATIAGFGHRTRRNLRRALQQSERNGWRFVPHLTFAELAAGTYALHDRCLYPFSRATAELRLQHVRAMAHPVAMGLLAADGTWLSCMVGCRTPASTDILWQANATGHTRDSLCTTMRTLLMRHEIERGTPLIRYIGGANALMERALTPVTAARISVSRPGLRLGLMSSIPRAVLAHTSDALGTHTLQPTHAD